MYYLPESVFFSSLARYKYSTVPTVDKMVFACRSPLLLKDLIPALVEGLKVQVLSTVKGGAGSVFWGWVFAFLGGVAS